MVEKLIKIAVVAMVTGFIMWVIGGLWHNLVMPLINVNAEAHHEGLVLMLVSYFMLSIFMVLLFLMYRQKNDNAFAGLKAGVFIGIVWVFPHGLALAGAHGGSIAYEFRNTAYHIFEQGLGGLTIYYCYKLIDKIFLRKA